MYFIYLFFTKGTVRAHHHGNDCSSIKALQNWEREKERKKEEITWWNFLQLSHINLFSADDSGWQCQNFQVSDEFILVSYIDTRKKGEECEKSLHETKLESNLEMFSHFYVCVYVAEANFHLVTVTIYNSYQCRDQLERGRKKTNGGCGFIWLDSHTDVRTPCYLWGFMVEVSLTGKNPGWFIKRPTVVTFT